MLKLLFYVCIFVVITSCATSYPITIDSSYFPNHISKEAKINCTETCFNCRWQNADGGEYDFSKDDTADQWVFNACYAKKSGGSVVGGQGGGDLGGKPPLFKLIGFKDMADNRKDVTLTPSVTKDVETSYGCLAIGGSSGFKFDGTGLPNYDENSGYTVEVIGDAVTILTRLGDVITYSNIKKIVGNADLRFQLFAKSAGIASIKISVNGQGGNKIVVAGDPSNSTDLPHDKLEVVVYPKKQLEKFRIYEVVPGSLADYKFDPYRINTELNKYAVGVSHHNKVYNAGKTINLDGDNNGFFDRFVGYKGVPSGFEEDLVKTLLTIDDIRAIHDLQGSSQLPEDKTVEVLYMDTPIRTNYVVTADIPAKSNVIFINATEGFTAGDELTLCSFDGTNSETVIISDAPEDTDNFVKIKNGTRLAHAKNSILVSKRNTLGFVHPLYPNAIVLSKEGTSSEVLMHELMHTAFFGNLDHVPEKGNLMYYEATASNTILRKRLLSTDPRKYVGGTEKTTSQWDKIHGLETYQLGR